MCISRCHLKIKLLQFEAKCDLLCFIRKNTQAKSTIIGQLRIKNDLQEHETVK